MGEGLGSVPCTQDLRCVPASCSPRATRPVPGGTSTDGTVPSTAPGRHHTSGVPGDHCTAQPLLSALSFGAGMEIHTVREKDQERHGPTKEELLQNRRKPRSKVKHHYI